MQLPKSTSVSQVFINILSRHREVVNYWKMKVIGVAAVVAVESLIGVGVVDAGTLAIRGGTLIDVSHYGTTSNDIPDATVIVTDGKITYAGPAVSIKIPAGAKRINARGRYLVPGLIDGFASLRDQGFANAFLYEGVTSVYVVAPDGADEWRGRLATGLNPSPFVLLGGDITGYSVTGESINDGDSTAERLHQEPLSRAQIIARVNEIDKQGRRGIWLDYDVWPYQVDAAIEAARPLGLASIGELGYTSYAYGVRAGVDSFVHTSRYTSALALPSQLLAYADAPFSEARRATQNYVCTVDVAAELFKDYARSLSKSQTALMPTEAMGAQLSGLPGLENPWSRPSAALIAPDQLHLPLNPRTGLSELTAKLPPAELKHRADCKMHEIAMNNALHAAGAHFLAASGTSAFGMMPGGGMHLEISLFVDKIGMTPREALASATSNYADTYGWTDIGRIEPGRRGDILLLSEDPRLSVKALDRIETLILAGERIARAPLLHWRLGKR